jgi:hypothetical protein
MIGAEKLMVGTLRHYQDLVFSPLALPAPPAVDTARLVRWMKWARMESRRRGDNRSERGYEEQTGKRYPWLMATVQLAEPGAVERSFRADFAPVVDYAGGLPFKAVRTIFLIAQRAGADVHLHTDGDGFWGFRFYLAHQHREGLYFCMARERVAELPRRTDDWSPYLDVSNRHYARWPRKNMPFCLNSIRAAHAVDPNRCRLGDRIACVVAPEDLDRPRLLELLERSSERFGDRQIWYRQRAAVASLSRNRRSRAPAVATPGA